MKYEYLIFNLIVFAGPICGAFLYKKSIWPQKKAMIKSIFLPFLLFVVFDILVNKTFWWFNPDYTTGIKFMDLPFEELLFFVTVPFACLFLWVNWEKRFAEKSVIKFPYRLLLVLSFALTVFFILIGLYYTSYVFWGLFTVLYLDLKSKKLFTGRHFLIFAFFVVVLTAIFNLYLTARPVVLYNTGLKTNINFLTIPWEDFLYGLNLILMVVILYQQYKTEKL